MKKLENIEELAKALGQAAGYFTKNAEFHKAAHAEHTKIHAHHEAHAAFHKAAHDAMDDGHEMKAHVGKVHEHHVAKAAYHKSVADIHKGFMEDATKLAAAFGGEPELQKGADGKTIAPTTPAPAGIEGMVAETTKGLVSKSLEMLQTDPTIQDEIRKMVLEGVKSALGGQVRPDGVRGFFAEPAASTDGLRLVNRAGGPTSVEKTQVSPDMDEALAL